jgi:ABC transport system ATP-binding/permease protein
MKINKNVISVENLYKEFPGKIICENETFGIHENDKIGLIGINGCGKSTLLKMLAATESPDSGKITFRNNIKIGFLPQIPVLNPEFSIYEQIYQSDHPAFALLREFHKNGGQTGTAEKIEAIDGWKIEQKAKSYLTKLGFDDLDKKIGLLSGGQKRRVDLARVLMDEPDVLILDEPTNHLDIDTIEWLQNYFAEYKGIILFVTHDRYFLDTVSNKIMEIEKGKFRFIAGNYTHYLKQKEILLVDENRKETRRKAQLKKEMKWLMRGARARTSKPKNHLDRVKELIDKSYLSNDAEMDISFVNKRLGKSILEINNVSKSYDKTLFSNFSHIFQKNERIGIIGANGCGKTTLLKLITKEAEAESGKIKIGMNTSFSYFKQEVDDFSKNISVIDYIRSFAENIRTTDGVLHSAKEMLQRFLFDGKMQQNKISSLSGGEKKRLYLLKSLMFGSNFIILDEPTNDLDIKTLEILEDYLDAFKGCILVVSHDRFFLDRVTDYLFIFEEDGIRKFPGNYSDYLLVKRFKKEVKQSGKPEKIREKTKAKLSFNDKRELESLETEIPKLENELTNLDKRIEVEAANLKAEEFKEITDRQLEIEEKLEEFTERWIELEDKV